MASSSITDFADAALDALPDATAVLDSVGTIVAVNHAWRMFSVDNGGRPEATGVGVNYLQLCNRSAAAGCADGAAVRDGIESVLDGHSVHRELEYPCPSPAAGRWFLLRVNPLPPPARGAVVSHVNITRRKLAEQELAHAAAHDTLTALANRALFEDRLSRALTVREDRSSVGDVGVLFLDLDLFKLVNDTYGHQGGDDVLQRTASRLREQTRPEHTVARLGGDEFAVLAPRITAAGIDNLAARITDAVREPHLIHGDSVTVAASVGIHLAVPGESVKHALRCADEAMYRIKRERTPESPRRSPAESNGRPSASKHAGSQAVSRTDGAMAAREPEPPATTLTPTVLPAMDLVVPARADSTPAKAVGAMQPLRVLLVDDTADIRQLLIALFARRSDVEVIAEAGNGREAIDLAAALQPDIIVLDVAMPVLDGISALPTLVAAAPHARIVMLSALPADRRAPLALAAGAAAYVEKTTAVRTLVDELLEGAKLLDVAVRCLSEQVHKQFDADPRQVHFARRFVTDTLERWEQSELADTVALLLSELVTNAIVHARAAPRVNVRLLPDRVHVEVTDQGAQVAHLLPPDLDRTSGRGLVIVEALAMGWGSAPLPDGKIVWFDVARHPA